MACARDLGCYATWRCGVLLYRMGVQAKRRGRRAGASKAAPQDATPAPRWDRKRILAAIVEWTRETGRPPFSYEWAPGTARSAGLSGPTPSKWERERPRWPGTLTVYRHFGSWPEALHAAGVAEATTRVRGTPGERVKAARRLRARGVKVAAIADRLGVATGTVYLYLSAGECKQCGGPLVRGAAYCRSCGSRGWASRSWSRREVLDAAREWMRLEGRPPTKTDWRGGRSQQAATRKRQRPRWPSVHAVEKLFGGWSEMLVVAGLRRARRSRSAGR
jgi:hypothetical protein